MFVKKFVNKIIQITEYTNLPIFGITLLSEDEFRELKDWIRSGTGCWWLRSPGDYDDTAAAVDGNGDVAPFGYHVNDYTIGVRPALRINLKSSDLQITDTFQFGGYTWRVISDDYALCDETIGSMAFREDSKAPDANVYGKSDIKKCLKLLEGEIM